MKNKVVAVVGPTASGKSALAIDIAKKYGGEVVSADSMQIYRGMDIGTAKITDTEGIPHHLIDIVDPSDTYTLSDYLSDADKAVKDILSRGKLPIMAGGTGLYISSFIDNIQLTEAETDEEYREYLKNFARENGAEKLHSLLADIDPESYKTLHVNDEKRVIRALEFFHTTGKTITEHNAESRSIPSPYDFFIIGITFRDRQKLYDRIDRRVDMMIEDGFVEEVKRLDFESLSKTARQAIGYRQIFAYLDGIITLDDAVEDIKRESRRYAKRQLTWFRRDSRINWLYADDNELNCELFETSMENFLDV